MREKVPRSVFASRAESVTNSGRSSSLMEKPRRPIVENDEGAISNVGFEAARGWRDRAAKNHGP
jgi:hypothetical protein